MARKSKEQKVVVEPVIEEVIEEVVEEVIEEVVEELVTPDEVIEEVEEVIEPEVIETKDLATMAAPEVEKRVYTEGEVLEALIVEKTKKVAIDKYVFMADISGQLFRKMNGALLRMTITDIVKLLNNNN